MSVGQQFIAYVLPDVRYSLYLNVICSFCILILLIFKAIIQYTNDNSYVCLIVLSKTRLETKCKFLNAYLLNSAHLNSGKLLVELYLFVEIY